MSPLSQHIVLGAGLMGRLLAFELARLGHAVRVFDAGGPGAEGSAARVAAAMLAPLAESAVTEAMVVRMGLHGLTRWPEIIANLSQPVFFDRQGTLLLWHRQDAAEAARLRHQLDVNQKRLPALPAPQALDTSAITALEPALGRRFAQGLLLPGEGQLDNRALLDALLDALVHLKVDLNWHAPRSPADFLQGDLTPSGWVFDCRGLGARPEWPTLRGVRGEVVRVHAPDVELARPIRLVHPRYPLYIAPKPGHVFVIGATEIESDDMSPASVRSTLELLSAAYSVHPGFAEARILEIATQCRPALPDNLPAIQKIGARTIQINGLYRHGFLIAPALLDIVMQLTEGAPSPLADELGLTIESDPTQGSLKP